MFIIYFFYFLFVIILCFLCFLIFYNLKKYNNNEEINEDLKKIKDKNIYEKIIKKNLNQIAIKGKINIDGMVDANQELKYEIGDKKQEIIQNDYKNKNKELDNQIDILIKENEQLIKDLEEIKRNINNLVSGVQLYINKNIIKLL